MFLILVNTQTKAILKVYIGCIILPKAIGNNHPVFYFDSSAVLEELSIFAISLGLVLVRQSRTISHTPQPTLVKHARI